MEDVKNSWVKLHRKFLNWGWYDDINVKVLFIHLLLKANYQDKKWHGLTVKRGQIVTSLKHLSEETGLSIQNIRTSMGRLKSTHELTHQTTSHYTVITIVNYDKYQSNQHTSQQTTNKQLTTTKEYKNIRIEHICSFETFWGLYPKKVSKKKAQAVYKRICTSKIKEKNVLEGLSKYIEKWRVEGTDVQYIPNPTTWLNQERWADDIVISNEPYKKNSRKFESAWVETKQKEKQKYVEYLTDDLSGGLVKLSELMRK